MNININIRSISIIRMQIAQQKKQPSYSSDPFKHSLTKFANKGAQNYISVTQNNMIYIIECYDTLPETEQQVHVYSILQNAWRLFQVTTCRTRSGILFPKKDASCVVVDGNLYYFGGRNGKGMADNRLAILNLEKKCWRGDADFSTTNPMNLAPEPRINANLDCYRNKFLILYGGTSLMGYEVEQANYLWIFQIEKNYWFQVQNMRVPFLQNSTLCLQDHRIYIFGHQFSYQPRAQSSQLLQIKIQITEEKDKFPLSFEKVEVLSSSSQSEEPVPYKGVFYKLFSHKNKTLLLFEAIAGSATEGIKTRVWIFDKPIQKWIYSKIEIASDPVQILEVAENTYYLFDKPVNFETNIHKITLSEEYLKKVQEEARYKSWKTCEICYEAYLNKNALMESAFKITKQMLETLTEKINFPFACFGIFAENALNLAATNINFHYLYYKQQPIIKIEDDIRLNYTNEQLEEVIVNFSAETNYNFNSVEKRTRGILAKDYLKKQFGTNLKIAGLRLGSQLLYISSTPSYEARVAYFTLEEDEYVCYYYAFQEKTNKTVDDYSIETKMYVQSKYGDLIAKALHENPGSAKYGQYKNSLYIIGLRTVANELGKQAPELQPYWIQENKDIIYISSNPVIYKSYCEYGCRLNEAIDVSLNAYLSHFFIKNDHMRMTIQIFDSEKRLVKKQEPDWLEKGSMIKVVTAIDSSLKNYDLKVVQLLFNNKLNRKLGVFHNGILLYHKNRLVKRFGCELGDLLNSLEFTQRLSYGYFNVFGRIEVPDSLEVNQQKTDFVNKLMLQKLYSRLNVINDVLMRSVDNDKDESKLINPKQGPRLRSRAEDHDLRQNPTKKVKKSMEDQSYHAV